MASAAERRLVTRLRQRKHREAEGLFVAEGVRVVEELLASAIVPRLAVISSSLEDSERGSALRAALERRTEVRVIDDHQLARLADTEAPQGVLVAAEIPVASLSDVAPAERSLILVLDAVQDPGNLGTLARSAAALGAGAMVLLPGTVDAWNPKAVRASAGASFRLHIVATEWPALASWLEGERYGVYVADAAGRPVDSVSVRPRAALVVGNEGAGVGAEARAAAEALVAVPIRGVESLNVAVATGILLWELRRTQGEGGR